jgi:hypothetical protein
MHQRHWLTSRIDTIQDAVTFRKKLGTIWGGDENRMSKFTSYHKTNYHHLNTFFAHRGYCKTVADWMKARSISGERQSTGIGDITTHHNPRITEKEAREQGERTDRQQIQVTHPVKIAWILTHRDSKATLRLYPETHQTVTSETRNNRANQQVQIRWKNETVAQDWPGILSYPPLPKIARKLILIMWMKLLEIRKDIW